MAEPAAGQAGAAQRLSLVQWIIIAGLVLGSLLAGQAVGTAYWQADDFQPSQAQPLLPSLRTSWRRSPRSCQGRTQGGLPRGRLYEALGFGHHAYHGVLEQWRGDPFACNASGWAPRAWLHGTGWDSGEDSDGGDADSGAALFGTAAAQSFIARHQHPPNCSEAKFFLHSAHWAGVGSQIHMHGAALAVAIKMGRVFLTIYDEHDTQYTNGSWCPPQSPLDSCILEPASGCSLADAGWPNSTIHGYDGGAEDGQEGAKTVYLHGYDFNEQQEIPFTLKQLLAGSPIAEDRHKYWWRAQATAYLMRPNQRSLEEVAARRGRIFPRQLPPGAINLHVRHGDKRTEASLIDNSVYWRKAQRVYRDSLAAHPSAGGPLSKTIFLTTYDPQTVQYFENVTAAAGWGLLYTDIPRFDNDTSATTFTYVDRIGGAEEMLNSLVNLDLTLGCGAWIGTFSSNWCRLIDELRSTIACAAHRVYMDAEQKYPFDNQGTP